MSSVFLLLAVGCDHYGQLFVPSPNAEYPFIQDLGERRVIPASEYSDSEWSPLSEDAQAAGDDGAGVHYGGLGAPEDPAYYGGATLTFTGTGGDVCIVLDPEAVYWIQAWSPKADANVYRYEDEFSDDGDVDLNVGLTAYYTGSPGVSMGDFKLPYTDEAGVEHALEFNECYQAGYQGDSVHAGRGSVEACTIDTFGRTGVSFTAVLNTFMLPIDDSVVHFAAGVYEGSCSDLAGQRAIDECFYPEEFGPSQEGTDNDVSDCGDPDETWSYACLEQMYCDKARDFNEYCEQHFDDGDSPCIDNGVHPPEDDSEDGSATDR